ncbi:MAG: hypothetical protein OXH84_01645 [Gammaproteobacteria bacterium]|nr:hypothetical protein [Gammaproteobacteria bacterium]
MKRTPVSDEALANHLHLILQIRRVEVPDSHLVSFVTFMFPFGRNVACAAIVEYPRYVIDRGSLYF